MYNMPSIFSLFEQQIPEWTLFLNQLINSVDEAAWKREIESKPSLKYVGPDSLKVEPVDKFCR